MTAITEGKSGVKVLWKRFWNRNLSLKWLLVALLGYDVLRLVANIFARTIDGQVYPIVDLPNPLWMIIPLFLQAFILSGMGEEFGWRGYALPRFQANRRKDVQRLVRRAFSELMHKVDIRQMSLRHVSIDRLRRNNLVPAYPISAG